MLRYIVEYLRELQPDRQANLPWEMLTPPLTSFAANDGLKFTAIGVSVIAVIFGLAVYFTSKYIKKHNGRGNMAAQSVASSQTTITSNSDIEDAYNHVYGNDVFDNDVSDNEMPQNGMFNNEVYDYDMPVHVLPQGPMLLPTPPPSVVSYATSSSTASSLSQVLPQMRRSQRIKRPPIRFPNMNYY